MKAMKIRLCPPCDDPDCPSECPEVGITDSSVTIGEEANAVRLSHLEWNELVRLIKTGELSEVH